MFHQITWRSSDYRKHRNGDIMSVARPKVISDYFNNAGAINSFNRMRTSSRGIEDTWRTMDTMIRQFAGLLGFVKVFRIVIA